MIFEKIHDRQNLEAAWRHVRSKNPQPGIDRVRAADFEKHLDANLAALQKEIMTGVYQPRPVMAYQNRRGKGPGRTVGISTLRDRVVQQAAVDAMTPVFEPTFLPCSFAYRRKKSAHAAVKMAERRIKAGGAWVAQMDVAHFFDSIDHAILLKAIRETADEKPLLRLIARLLQAKIFKQMGLFDVTVGSQQGSGLSPLLSNIYLGPLDKAMWKAFQSDYLRYSDDVTVFSTDQDRLKTARTLVENELASLKLTLNREKTRVTHISAGFVYLGFYMDARGKGPGKKSIEHLEEKLKGLAPLRRNDILKKRLDDVMVRVRGWRNYYQSVQAVTPPNLLSLVSLAKLAHESGETKYARELIRQHEIFSHNHPEMSVHIGDLFREFGMGPQAAREYARALELDPSLSSAKDRVRSLSKQSDNDHTTIENLKKVLHHNPHYREGYERLAEQYATMGLYGFAEKAARRALDLDDSRESGESAERIVTASRRQCEPLAYNEGGLSAFLNLFKGRSDAHARQWVDERGRAGFLRVERPIKEADVKKHLDGVETLAVYPVTENDAVRFIIFDVDVAKRAILTADEARVARLVEKTHGDILRIKSVCRELGMPFYIEDSGYKGRHGWVFFDRELNAAKSILLGQEILKRAGGPSDDLVWEMFPHGKIDRHQCLMKLPLGVNRKNNRRCVFLEDDGLPVADPFSMLQAIRKFGENYVQTDAVEARAKPREDIEVGKKGEIEAPDGVREMVNGCGVLKHLVLKARDTSYLTHYERICLLYTITFAGDAGNDFLHQVMRLCMNYNHQCTQRYIDRRKESPISCAKIMENFSDLGERFCGCKFNVPPRGYPSPVLYILEAEMEKTSLPESFSRENPSPADKPGGKDAPGPEENQLLDFEDIFSDETANGPAKNGSDDPVPLWESSVEQDAMASPAEPEPAPPGLTSLNDEHAGVDPSDGWTLFLEYLRLRQEQQRVAHDLDRATRALERYFELLGKDVLETQTGCVRKIESEGGAFRWELRCF